MESTNQATMSFEESGYTPCRINANGNVTFASGIFAWQKELDAENDASRQMYVIPLHHGMTYTHGEESSDVVNATEWAVGICWPGTHESAELMENLEHCGFGLVSSSHSQNFYQLPCFGSMQEALSFAGWGEQRYRGDEMHPGMINYIGDELEDAANLYPTIGEVRDFWMVELGNPDRADNLARHRDHAHWRSGAFATSEDLGWPSPTKGDLGLSVDVVPYGSVWNLIRGDGEFGVQAKMSLEIFNYFDTTWSLGSDYDVRVAFDNAPDYLAFQKRMDENEAFAQEFLIEHAPFYEELPEAARDFVEQKPLEYAEEPLIADFGAWDFVGLDEKRR